MTTASPAPPPGPPPGPGAPPAAQPVDLKAVLSRLFDPSLVIATIAAVLYFSGWTYYRAYLGRLGLDPAGMGLASFTLAVEGAGALLTAFGFWLLTIVVTLFLVSLLVLAAVWFERRFAGRRWIGDATTLIYLMLRIVLIVLIAWVIVEAGSKAGAEKANAQFRSVQCGDVWDYRTSAGTTRGITVAQTDSRIWILTAQGVQPVKIEDLKAIGGTLLEKVKTGEGGCRGPVATRTGTTRTSVAPGSGGQSDTSSPPASPVKGATTPSKHP